MASSYKYFTNNDRVVGTNELKKVVLNEKSSSWASQEYTNFTQYGSGSSTWALATRTFDITFGRSSEAVTGSDASQLSYEHNVYNQFAKVLLGHDETNAIRKFNLDPEDTTGAKVLHNAYFVNLARSQFSDKISQGSFKLTFNVSGSQNLDLVDSGSAGVVTRTCNTGIYGKLFVTGSGAGIDWDSNNEVQGLVFYEAGVAVVSPYIFAKSGSASNPSSSNQYINENILGVLTGDVSSSLSGAYNLENMIVTGSILQNNYALSSHLLTASYTSVTELNSTIYFCRAFNHEFNYSSNPTYLEDSKIVVKGGDPEVPTRTYVTTVGLYSDDNQLLAVAKLSEPVVKTPENELIARVRLDF